ncbi:MAG TPA: tRNA epoxyqueuosine(34) reductase QueG [Candidatus Didemnitutus sp.]|nr:tRNA epoxyqueuosine(34) reductase QueG [Candidatus Didemnitutus sp.]
MKSVDTGVWTARRRVELRRRLRKTGFDEVRFATVESGIAGGLPEWLAEGMQADMAWMERSAAKRADPDLVLPGARSIIMLGVNYWGGRRADERMRRSGRPRWARYALHVDYHDTMKAGLVAAGRVLEDYGAAPTDYRYYVDTGPVLERGWAARAGIGFLGKNGMLISRRHGNWLFLAAILTRFDLAPDEPMRPRVSRANGQEPPGLLCGSCTRCLTACPTAAIPRPGVVDARRCISYQTIENRGGIPRELRAGIGTRIYGCDVCLEVCPWNRFARAGRRILLEVRSGLAELDLKSLLELTPEKFAAEFKGTAVKRLKLTGLLRNACVVAGNTAGAGDDVRDALVRLAAHDSPVVRAHAVWALRRRFPGSAAALLERVRAMETDPGVLAEYDAPSETI